MEKKPRSYRLTRDPLDITESDVLHAGLRGIAQIAGGVAVVALSLFMMVKDHQIWPKFVQVVEHVIMQVFK